MNAPILPAEHRRILAGLAMDTGGFRVSNRQASDIAAACAAALKLAADAAELIDAARDFRDCYSAHAWNQIAPARRVELRDRYAPDPGTRPMRATEKRFFDALARMGEKA